jgi:hypothetical protein
MEIIKEEYYFMEWLILGKGLTEPQYKDLSEKQLTDLKHEYNQFKRGLKPL